MGFGVCQLQLPVTQVKQKAYSLPCIAHTLSRLYSFEALFIFHLSGGMKEELISVEPGLLSSSLPVAGRLRGTTCVLVCFNALDALMPFVLHYHCHGL